MRVRFDRVSVAETKHVPISQKRGRPSSRPSLTDAIGSHTVGPHEMQPKGIFVTPYVSNLNLMAKDANDSSYPKGGVFIRLKAAVDEICRAGLLKSGTEIIWTYGLPK